MPNIENIKLAITVMERVKKNEEELGRRLLDLRMFQGAIGDARWKVAYNEEEVLNQCGTVCCIAGWLAVSPEFIKIGYSFGHRGIPRLATGMSAEDSLECILGLNTDAVMSLIYNAGNEGYYYGKPSDEVTVDDVIGKLKALIGENN